ncbi:MAG: type IX secretion system membrane protein PorP/SprF [Bacteroidales bacterium]|nr:type IX secretion system membrane protein PorP/SprF [Bacteroidales bacterium]
MRRLLIGLLCGFTMVFDIIAQQDPQYSQYMFNQMAVNPGYAGSHDAICLTAVHRQQWVGIDGAPNTSVFTVNTPFKLFGASHGAGVTIMSDQIGFNTNVSAGLDYAFRLPLGPGKLGIGVSGMFLNKALAATWSIPGSDWISDPSIPKEDESVMGFDMGVGVFYRAEKVYLGLSSTHLLGPSMKYDKDEANAKLTRHYYATAGCLLPLNNPAWEIAPSLMAYSDGTTSQLTTNVNIMYNKKFWGGVGYRMNDAVIVMIGVDLFNGLKVGYAFDYTYSSLHKYFSAGGSHEVMVSYCFNLVKERVVKKYKSVRFL